MYCSNNQDNSIEPAIKDYKSLRKLGLIVVENVMTED